MKIRKNNAAKRQLRIEKSAETSVPSLRASSLFGSHARFILGASGERPREDWGGGEINLS